MVEVGGRIVLAAVLVAASVAKLASPRSSSAALGTFGIRSSGGRWAAWAVLIATELALAAGVAAGIDLAAYLAAGLMAAFGAAMLAALQRGRAGAPCACFGARSTVGWPAVARNLVLSFAFLALPLLPEGELTTDEWLGLGLGVALLACAGLAIAVLALAREVGMLRLRLGPAAALSIPGSPFAVALDPDGTVLAKGTFNNLAQLESILATAERRRAERGTVEALGV